MPKHTIEPNRTATRSLDSVALLLRHTTGFMFLPLLAESERSAIAATAYLQIAFEKKFYAVVWPIGGEYATLLGNIDDAINKLPANSVIVLNACSSVRHEAALQAAIYINLRRESLLSAKLRFILCWPTALKDELMARMPDLWSVRTDVLWICEGDLSDDLLPRIDAALNETD